MPKFRTLSALVFLGALAALAPAQDAPLATTPPAKVDTRTAPEVRIDEAIKALKDLPSASADLKVAADMLNQKFDITGTYLKAPGYKIYLKMDVNGLGNVKGRMIQACDGTFVWNYNRIVDDQGCEKFRLKPVLEALDKPECDPELRANLLSGLGFVGPDALLAGLRNSFVFDQVREVEFEGKVVYIFGGSWKNTQTLVGPNGLTFNPAGAPLPPYVPSLVTLYLGKFDNWPHKVVFEGRIPAQMEKKEQREIGPDGRPLGRKMTGPGGRPSTVTLSYSNVLLNAPIPDASFAFAPPENVRTGDSTEKLVNDLNQIIASQAARKKAEAAKVAPTLDDALPAPGPGVEGAPSLPGPTPR